MRRCHRPARPLGQARRRSRRIRCRPHSRQARRHRCAWATCSAATRAQSGIAGDAQSRRAGEKRTHGTSHCRRSAFTYHRRSAKPHIPGIGSAAKRTKGNMKTRLHVQPQRSARLGSEARTDDKFEATHCPSARTAQEGTTPGRVPTSAEDGTAPQGAAQASPSQATHRRSNAACAFLK